MPLIATGSSPQAKAKRRRRLDDAAGGVGFPQPVGARVLELAQQQADRLVALVERELAGAQRDQRARAVEAGDHQQGGEEQGRARRRERLGQRAAAPRRRAPIPPRKISVGMRERRHARRPPPSSAATGPSTARTPRPRRPGRRTAAAGTDQPTPSASPSSDGRGCRRGRGAVGAMLRERADARRRPRHRRAGQRAPAAQLPQRHAAREQHRRHRRADQRAASMNSASSRPRDQLRGADRAPSRGIAPSSTADQGAAGRRRSDVPAGEGVAAHAIAPIPRPLVRRNGLRTPRLRGKSAVPAASAGAQAAIA